MFHLSTLVAKAGAGDILSAVIETNGWVMDVAIEGMQTNGTHSFGLGVNNSISGNENIVLKVTSLGYDDSGMPIRVSRNIVGTYALRFPFPDNSFKDQRYSNDIIINKIVLSDYVYAKDSNLVVRINQAYYISNVTNNSATLPVQNFSTLKYPKPIGNWTWPGWSRITGDIFRLRAVAFHQHAQLGRPVRLMRFIARDAHHHSVTNDVLNMSLDRTMGDCLPFGEYVADLPTHQLAQGDLITNIFQAFPWIGDEPLNSSDGLNQPPTPLYSTMILLNDKDQQYGSTIAVVSPDGDDSEGAAINSSAFNNAAPPITFSTIGGAASAIVRSNLTLYGRNDAGSGVIYLRSGNYSWLGPNSMNYGATPNTFVEITTFPGDERASIISANAGRNTLSGKVKLSNLKIASAQSGTFAGETYLWFDNCVLDSTSSSLVYNCNIWFVTRSLIPTLSQGFSPFSTQNSAPALIRGNYITSVSGGGYAYTVCGNKWLGPVQGSVLSTDLITKTIPYPDGAIIYNNIFYRSSAALGRIYESYYTGFTNGLAVVQNLMECATNGNQQFFTISGHTATNTPLNNVIVWHNDIIGKGCDLAYNNVNSNPVERLLWSVKNNLFDKLNIKSDSTPPGNSTRTGNWSCFFGVSYSGNINANIQNLPGGSYNPEFLGLNSYQPAGISTSPSSYFHYKRVGSFDGIRNGSGFGDYHLDNDSPVHSVIYDWILPFDMDGHPRSISNLAGIFATESSSPPILEIKTVFPRQSKEPQFEIFGGTVGSTNIIQTSTNMASWITVSSNITTLVPWTYIDHDSSKIDIQFYRAIGFPTP